MLPLQSLPMLLFAADIAVAAAVVTLATLHLRPPKALPAGVWLLLCCLLPLPLLLFLAVAVAADIAVAAAAVTLATLHLRPPKALPTSVWLLLCSLLPLPLLLLLLCPLCTTTGMRPLKAPPT